MHALRKWVQAEVGFIYLELDNQIKSKCFTVCFRCKYQEETKKWPKVKHFSYFTKLAQIAECPHICQHFLDGRVAKDVTSSLLSRSAVLQMPSPTTTSSVESNYFSLTERKYVVLLIVIHFQNFHLPLEFSSGTNQTNVYHLFPNRNFREFVVNGKQPIIILMTIMLHFNLVPKLLSGYSSSPRQRLVGRTVGKTLIEFLYTTHTSLRIHMFPYG